LKGRIYFIFVQGVKGYMMIGDDTILNMTQLRNAPLDTLLFPRGFSTVRADYQHPWSWYWWPKSRGRIAAVTALADIEALSGLSQYQVHLHIDDHLFINTG
jgi:hypothetical protein